MLVVFPGACPGFSAGRGLEGEARPGPAPGGGRGVGGGGCKKIKIRSSQMRFPRFPLHHNNLGLKRTYINDICPVHLTS